MSQCLPPEAPTPDERTAPPEPPAAEGKCVSVPEPPATANDACFLNETQEYTASCPLGQTGADVTITKRPSADYAAATRSAANALALAAATAEANAALVCEFWNEEQSYTAECPEGYTGDPVEKTIPAETLHRPTLAEANAAALALAQEQAQAALACEAIGGGGGEPYISFDGPVTDIFALAGGKWLIAGQFTAVNFSGTEVAANCFIRLNPDLSHDPTFAADSNCTVPSPWTYSGGGITVGQDGKICVATSGVGLSVGGLTNQFLYRLNADGSHDSVFVPPQFYRRYSESTEDPKQDSAPNIALSLGNGKVVVGGNFTQIGTHPTFYMGLLNADGSVDTGFTSPYSYLSGSFIYYLEVDSTGTYLHVASDGGLVESGPVVYPALNRFNLSGLSHDTGFLYGGGGYGIFLREVSGGKLFAGGNLYNNTTAPNFENYYNPSGLHRLNSDGTVDGSFDANIYISSVQFNYASEMSDGVVLAVGSVGLGSTIGGVVVDRMGLFKFEADGTFDEDFDPGPLERDTVLAFQSAGAQRFIAAGKLKTDPDAWNEYTGPYYLKVLSSVDGSDLTVYP